MTKSSWHVQLYTLFPEMFPGSLGLSLAGKALENKIWSYETINLRDYGIGKHNQVDDTPAGGGAGMVMRPDVVGKALDDNLQKSTRLIYMSPRGKPLTQKLANKISKEQNIAIICGRFEGLDERVIDHYQIEEVSIGDYVLSGGEVAASVLMDACIRLLPGVLGNKDTLNEESFTNNDENADFSGLLEYPLYTKPSKWKNLTIPKVLLSGHHGEISSWRKKKSLEITKDRRPDLLEQP